ncbi:MAG: hypothetical protein ABW178_03855 [Pseudoxanthomonas sp.]
MENTTLNSTTVALAAATLLTLGLLAQGKPENGSETGSLPVRATEAEILEKAEDLVDPARAHSRKRGSLSMPYFSFAQMLRSRS